MYIQTQFSYAVIAEAAGLTHEVMVIMVHVTEGFVVAKLFVVGYTKGPHGPLVSDSFT